MKSAAKPPDRKLSAYITRSKGALVEGSGRENEVYKIELLLQQAHASLEDRRVVPASLELEKKTGAPAAALELSDGRLVYGKTSDLLGASAALLLNTLKDLAGIDHKEHVISPDATPSDSGIKNPIPRKQKSAPPHRRNPDRSFHKRSKQRTRPSGTYAASETERMSGTYFRSSVHGGYSRGPQTRNPAYLRTQIRKN